MSILGPSLDKLRRDYRAGSRTLEVPPGMLTRSVLLGRVRALREGGTITVTKLPNGKISITGDD